MKCITSCQSKSCSSFPNLSRPPRMAAVKSVGAP